MNQIKAKFQLTTVTKTLYGEESKLIPVYGDNNENKTYSSATPSGDLRLMVTNPDVNGFFEFGYEYVTTIEKVKIEKV